MRSSPRLVAFDVETTGMSPLRGHRVIEIGAVEILDGQRQAVFHSLIDCGRKIPLSAHRVHGITDAMLAGGK